MQYSKSSWRLAAALAIAGAASGSAALTVGRAQGVALVGRTLDVSVSVTLDGAGESLPDCTTAEVFYGDSRVDPARVRADLQPTSAGASVRIRAAVAIDEPVVTLYLNVGCTGKVTRRFVLLSEQPPSTQEAPRVAEAGVATPAAQPAPRSVRSSAAAQAPAAASEVRPGRPASAPRLALGASRREAPRAAARLKLEPLDLSEPSDPALRLSAEMAAPEVDAAGDKRVRAAALWRALTAEPEDLLRDSQRIATLEKDFTAVRQAVQRNDAALAGLRTELEQARAARYANPLVYTLAALLLLAVAAAVYGWRRRQQPAWADSDPNWWNAREGQVASDYVSVPAPPVGQAPLTEVSSATAARVAAVPELAGRPADAERVRAGAASRGHADFNLSLRSDFQHSQPAGMRAVRAEELHDVQQEADFFISLGDEARAIEVLRNHISMNPETSAVAWLDLLEIHHRLRHREDYESVRHEFLRNFNVQVPPFDAYGERPTGLEDHPDAMARIVALWPSRTVLDLIEESIFRKPGDSGAEAFSLEAYRDLLLLHHIGQEVVDRAQYPDAEGPTTGGFSHTVINPLSAQRSGAGSSFLPLPEFSDPSQLDVNLDEPVDPGQWIGQPRVARGASGFGNLLDFDLPDVPTTELKPDKKRE